MANELGRTQVILTGFTGAPGLMQFAFQGGTPGTFTTADATAANAAVHTFLAAITGAFGIGVNAQVQSAVPVVDWQTGALIRVEPATGVGLVVGTQSGNMLTAEGPLLQLFTQTVINRRLLRGRLFLTPSATGGLQANGSVLGTLSTAITNAGNALAATAAVTWSVWHRPVPFSTGSNGTVGAVVSVQSPGKVAVLRSRRD